MSRDELIARYGHWGEHPQWPVADWQYEVANNYTRRGYWDWVSEHLHQTTDNEDYTP